jgi:tyrosine-protein phosphatase SIW14
MNTFIFTRSLRSALIFTLLLGVACPSAAQTEPKYTELPNFHQLSAQLYRGAQPKADGIKRLAQLGIKTIVNLRADDERARAEEQEAKAAGLRYFSIPFKNLGRPTDEQIQQVLAIINSPENQPVFVHCRRGADRTGTVMAIYRIEHDGWTGGQAKKEANRYGMRFWQLGMKNYIKDYYRERLARKND